MLTFVVFDSLGSMASPKHERRHGRNMFVFRAKISCELRWTGEEHMDDLGKEHVKWECKLKAVTHVCPEKESVYIGRKLIGRGLR